MGLEFGELKHCALVPYGKEVKLMVQYQGWMALLWRYKAVTSIQARVVYEGDLFDVIYGSEVRIIHKPAFASSVPTHYYAMAKPTNGDMMLEVMTLGHVEAHMKQYAKGLDKKDSPWNTSFDAMALKTVLRKLMKLLPMAPDSPIIAAMKRDEELWEADVQQARLDKFRAISQTIDIPSEDEKRAARLRYNNAVAQAMRLKVDIKDLPTPKEPIDAKQVNAITDLIDARLNGLEDAQGASNYE